jgi:hypothetical protein
MERTRGEDISNVRCPTLVKIEGYSPIRLFEAIPLVAPRFFLPTDSAEEPHNWIF